MPVLLTRAKLCSPLMYISSCSLVPALWICFSTQADEVIPTQVMLCSWLTAEWWRHTLWLNFYKDLAYGACFHFLLIKARHTEEPDSVGWKYILHLRKQKNCYLNVSIVCHGKCQSPGVSNSCREGGGELECEGLGKAQGVGQSREACDLGV